MSKEKEITLSKIIQEKEVLERQLLINLEFFTHATGLTVDEIGVIASRQDRKDMFNQKYHIYIKYAIHDELK